MSTLRTLITLALILLPRAAPATELEAAVAAEQRLRADAEYLADDAREGRGVGTKGLDQAADYIARRYEQLGLRTKLINDAPFFVFSTRTTRYADPASRLELVSPAGQVEQLALGKQFSPISLTGDQSIDAPLAFVGYGISDSESGYDDYAGLDVKGKAVVILRMEPRQADSTSPFKGTETSEHAYLSRKVANAQAHGAVAVLFCSDAHSLMKKAMPDQLMPFRVNTRFRPQQVAVAHCLREPIDRVLQSAIMATLSDRETAIDSDLKPRSEELDGWRVRGRLAAKRKGNKLKNVLAMVGPHDATETVVVGAHYDHLGRGGSGSLAPWTKAIHNGADDNASGTCVLLEVARRVAERRGQLKRRVLFIAFSAEEQGLIGSERYCRAPLIPMEDTVAMLNLDMVGRLRSDKLTIYGTGTASEFNGMVDRFAERRDLQVTKRPGGVGPSDHASFSQRGVPVLHFFTGFHSDYHRPGDDAEKLNIAGMRRVSEMTTDMVMELATADDRPTRRSPAASRLFSPSVVMNVSVRGADGLVTVTAVQEGGPGAAAGLRSGDQLTRVNGVEIKQVADVRRAIQKQQPGDVVDVEILREKTKLGLRVKLAAP